MSEKLRIIHWKPEEIANRTAQLERKGYQVNTQIPAGRAFLKQLAEDKPAAVLIDLVRLPSQGRDMAVLIRRQASTRDIPLLFLGGDPIKVEDIRTLLPDAVYTDWEHVESALEQAIAHPPQAPVRPNSAFAAYAGKPLVDKLGIKAMMSVGLIDAPEDFEVTLGDLPEGARPVTGADPENGLLIWFVRSLADLQGGIDHQAEIICDRPMWIAWPKKSSGVKTDLTQQAVRESGLSHGLVDYKISAFDSTWSGLLFRKRK